MQVRERWDRELKDIAKEDIAKDFSSEIKQMEKNTMLLV